MAKKSDNVDNLKYGRIDITKFKNIDHSLVEIGGRSLLILGKNSAGKSSFIQAMKSPLNTKEVPSEPIKKGEERSTIEIELIGSIGGENKKYILDMFFTPGNKSGRIVVTNEKGETMRSPATFIKGLIGNVSCDPLKWLNESKEKKVKMLKELTGCAEKLDQIESEITDTKASIKAKKEQAEEMEAVLKNHGYTQDQIDLYSNKIDIQVLQNSSAEVSANLTTYNEVFTKTTVTFPNDIIKITEDIGKFAIERTRLANEIERLKQLVEVENDKITKCKSDIEVKESNIKKGEAWLGQTTKPDPNAINQQINDAISHNQHCDAITALGEKQSAALKAKQEVFGLEEKKDSLEKQRDSVIASSQLPIKGFSYSGDEIFIDGFPIERGQINSARLIDISVDIAIALNPTLKTIFIEDGSLLDDEGLRSIISKIEAKGYQAIIEIVDKAGGELAVKFTEEVLG